VLALAHTLAAGVPLPAGEPDATPDALGERLVEAHGVARAEPDGEPLLLRD